MQHGRGRAEGRERGGKEGGERQNKSDSFESLRGRVIQGGWVKEERGKWGAGRGEERSKRVAWER